MEVPNEPLNFRLSNRQINPPLKFFPSFPLSLSIFHYQLRIWSDYTAAFHQKPFGYQTAYHHYSKKALHPTPPQTTGALC
jgi:hypothetical protein